MKVSKAYEFAPGEYEEQKKRIAEEGLKRFRIHPLNTPTSVRFKSVVFQNLNSYLLLSNKFICPRCEDTEGTVEEKEYTCSLCEYSYRI